MRSEEEIREALETAREIKQQEKDNIKLTSAVLIIKALEWVLEGEE